MTASLSPGGGLRAGNDRAGAEPREGAAFSPARSASGELRRTGGGYKLPPQLKTHPAVLDIFDHSRRAASRTPYWLDRDESMYTEEALGMRERLRTNPGLIDAVRRFAHQVYRLDADGHVGHAEYARVHGAIVRVLMGAQVGEAEVARIVAEDWAADSKGTDVLDDGRLFDSLFELADTWCPGISAAEYLSFIDTLAYKLVAGEGQQQGGAPAAPAARPRSSSENRPSN